ARLRISPTKDRKRGCCRGQGNRSMLVTIWPASSRRWTSNRPRNPDPPVTKTATWCCPSRARPEPRRSISGTERLLSAVSGTENRKRHRTTARASCHPGLQYTDAVRIERDHVGAAARREMAETVREPEKMGRFRRGGPHRLR